MKKYFLFFFLLSSAVVFAQDDIYPSQKQEGTFYITHATIHIGNGQVINDGSIEVTNGKIGQVGTGINIPADAKTVDVKGQQVYPGLILPDCSLGLMEIGSAVRGSNDYRELGDWNSNIRSIVAYNTDSKIINTLKANGILLANVSPEGSLLTGSSTVVQLDAWNWEDASYKADIAMHLYMPNLLPRPGRFAAFFPPPAGPQPDPVKEGLKRVDEVKKFFGEAKAYLETPGPVETNLKFESLRSLFSKKQKLFVHCDQVKQMLIAVDFVRDFGIDVVIVGGGDSWQIADLLKKNNISVILSREHSEPVTEDDDIDQPFKTPSMLQKAGVLFALNDDFEEARFRNLSFNAGTAASYGLTKEEALQAITLNSAKILGIDDRTGSIESGKDANIIVSQGDILDMRSSNLSHAYIQGREVSLQNKQTQLYDRYMHKYGLK